MYVVSQKLKTANFTFMLKNSTDRFLIVRKDSSQEEINLNENGTSFWRISWQNDSSFYVKFLRCTKKISDEELPFIKLT